MINLQEETKAYPRLPSTGSLIPLLLSLTESVNPYYLLTFILCVTDNTDSDRLKDLLHAKRKKANLSCTQPKI